MASLFLSRNLYKRRVGLFSDQVRLLTAVLRSVEIHSASLLVGYWAVGSRDVHLQLRILQESIFVLRNAEWVSVDGL
jgi:hypothetical protein